MLEYFFKEISLDELREIKKLLNEKKSKLLNLDFNEPYIEYQQALRFFEIIQEKALQTENEKLANAQFIAKCYFHLFCNLASYFSMLKEKKYRHSWDTLQSCFNDIYEVGKFVGFEKRFELNFLNELLREYERLYPFNIFASSEYIVSKSECSICKKPMNSIKCPHIKGNLYWGEIACENILEIQTINAVALVTNPVDKRCVMEVSDDKRTKIDKFKMLDEFLQQNVQPFQLFVMKENIILKRDNEIKKQGANEFCLCGSGKKFKHCCKSKMYYKHHAFKIILKNKIQFYNL